MPITTYNASNTWTAPAGVTAATVKCIGNGGGGDSTGTGGAGAGGGAEAEDTVTVVPSTGYAVVIPAAAAKDADGGDVTFNTTSVVAKGGKKGAAGVGGAGGLASGSTGSVKRDGGTGGNTGGGGGGGGGGSAGTAAAGNNGTNGNAGVGGAGGAAVTGGGAGAAGGNAGQVGGIGSAPGGGGGGGGGLQDGGAGAVGRVIVQYASGISTATGPSAGNYLTNQNLDIVITWGNAITVTGTPRVVLTIGSSSCNADYLSGSGGTALTFRYTVQAGDLDTDGISCASSITLNGGTLADSDAVAAATSFTAPTLTTVTVNVATAGAIGTAGRKRHTGGIMRRRVSRRF